jgi:hypothetical protein
MGYVCMRRTIVGVIGGDKQMASGEALGRLIAEHSLKPGSF